MDDSDDAEAIHFNWIDDHDGTANALDNGYRRQHSIGNTSEDSRDDRSSSYGYFLEQQEARSQIKNTGWKDTCESKSQSSNLQQHPSTNARIYASEEKKSSWSRRNNDSIILTSFDSSRFSSINNISSIDALLDERQVNAEEVLTNLGFGPVDGNLKLENRIPLRFLKSRNRAKSLQITQFINAHADEFPETIARRKMLRTYQSSLDIFDDKRPHSCDCDRTSSEHDSNCLHGHRNSTESIYRNDESRGMINEDSVVRIMQSNIPARYLLSLSHRVNQKSIR